MEFRVAIFSLMLAYVTSDESFYETDLNPQSAFKDEYTDKSDIVGFVQPIDFSTITSYFSDSSSPFTQGFDYFGSESREKNIFHPINGRNLAFAETILQEKSNNHTGFVKPIQFISHFDGHASPSTVQYRPHLYKPGPPPMVKGPQDSLHMLPMSKMLRPGKSNYPPPRPDHPSPPIHSSSGDVEIFYPKEKLILPTKNGRPKPYDGYRSATENQDTRFSNPSKYHRNYYPNRHNVGPQKFRQHDKYEEEEEENLDETRNHKVQQSNEDENEELEEETDDESENPKSSGYKYQYDGTINIPDLIIKKYPYEKDFEQDFRSEFAQYQQPKTYDLEGYYGNPNFGSEEYNVASTEALSKNSNCRKVDSREKRGASNGETCYVCKHPKTGDSYERCAYETEPSSKTYYYGGSTSSSSRHNPEASTERRIKRSLDLSKPSGFQFMIFNEHPNLNRKVREEGTFYNPSPYRFPKRKSKKFIPSSYKKAPKPKRSRDTSPYVESYEGPLSAYEGPSNTYEGPDHDDYYDQVDDRIPHPDNRPMYSSFLDDFFYRESDTNQKRLRRRPEHDYDPYNLGTGFNENFRFGPEYFEEFEGDEKSLPTKRDVLNKKESKKETESKKNKKEKKNGNVKIFKNGDVCKKTKKDKMICMICKNDKNGASYEQCQYTTKPENNKYTYGHQTSYSTNKPREQREIKRPKDQNPAMSNKLESKIVVTNTEEKIFDSNEPEQSDKLQGDPKEEEPETKDNGKVSEKKGKQNNDNFPVFDESYEDYFKRVFPEFERYRIPTEDPYDPYPELGNFQEDDNSENNEKSSENQEENQSDASDIIDQKTAEFEHNEKSKEDMEKEFGEFQKKNRSSCERIENKEKMMCFSCVDEEGTKYEECMFAEGLKPIVVLDNTEDKTDIVIQQQQPINLQEPIFETTENSFEGETQTEMASSEVESTTQKGDLEGVERIRDDCKTHPKTKKNPKKYEQPHREIDELPEFDAFVWESVKNQKLKPEPVATTTTEATNSEK